MEIINYEYKKVDNQEVIAAIEKKAKTIAVETNFRNSGASFFVKLLLQI